MIAKDVAQVSNLLYRRFPIGRSIGARMPTSAVLKTQPGSRMWASALRFSASHGFSLIEIMIAVSLLAVIMVGLLAMYYQTDKAFRMGTRQVDVLESGRSVMELLARELQEFTPAPDNLAVNLYASNTIPPLPQPRPAPAADHLNVLQDYFFLTRSNDMWTGIGYIVEPDPNGWVGSLYRYGISTYSTNAPDYGTANLYYSFQAELNLTPFPTANFHRVADNIIHLRVIPYDTNGVAYHDYQLLDEYRDVRFLDSQNNQNFFNSLNYLFPAAFTTDAGLTRDFISAPRAVDLEVGILDARIAEKYRAIANRAQAYNFLTNQAGNVHLFRHRISFRSRQ